MFKEKFINKSPFKKGDPALVKGAAKMAKPADKIDPPPPPKRDKIK
jgi:hypothetical protein